MASYLNQDFTTFRGVNTRGTIAMRFAADVDGNQSTLSVQPSLDAARAWKLPDKSGIISLSGTFAVNLPAVAGFGETAVTVSGIRREDILSVSIRDMGATVTTGRGFPLILGARPENGYIYMTFGTTGTSSLYADLVCSYTVAR